MLKFTIPIAPRTKKNSQRIVLVKGRPIIMPSKLYKQFEKDCKPFIPIVDSPIDYPVTVKCLYFMPSKRKVDLTNLLEATDDILVFHNLLADDNSNIICSHDGSRVFYDKLNPRTEIFIYPFIDSN